MRKRRTSSGLTVNAIAGSHVVHLGLSLSAAARKGCLGFAVQREDHSEDERYWMSGTKTFAATDPGVGPGGQVPTREHPLQTFQWADYSAKPDHDYTYQVLPLYGTPAHLREGDAVSVRVTTESEQGKPHAVFFNRGAIASQEYARRFQNEKPSKVGTAAYNWLSRGLFEAFETFVARARDASWEIHGAVYELQWPQALAALKDAKQAGAKLRLLYDAIPGASGPKQKNEAALAAAGLTSVATPRTKGKIMHNKFFVLSKDGVPRAVWTGSTNLTENGIFGHSNCGHLVESRPLAAAFLAYWKQMARDETTSDEKDWTDAENPAPPEPWSEDLVEVFSPRRGLDVLDWYAGIAGGAQRALLMTFAFGMHDKFKAVYERNDGVLRYALMEKEGNGSGLAQGRKDIARIRRLPNVIVAIGNNLALNAFDRWLRETDKATASSHVRFVHTKYMLVDPLAEEPVVVTGSANFSKASTDTNHENMLVIRGDQRVADIYFGEFLRLHTHYAFREAVKIAREQGDTDWQPKHLLADDKWQTDAYTAGHSRQLRRVYFSGG